MGTWRVENRRCTRGAGAAGYGIDVGWEKTRYPTELLCAFVCVD